MTPAVRKRNTTSRNIDQLGLQKYASVDSHETPKMKKSAYLQILRDNNEKN